MQGLEKNTGSKSIELSAWWSIAAKLVQGQLDHCNHDQGQAVRCRVEISWAIKRTNRSNVQTDVNYESFMPPHVASVSSAGVLVEPGDPRIWGSGPEESRRRLM